MLCRLRRVAFNIQKLFLLDATVITKTKTKIAFRRKDYAFVSIISVVEQNYTCLRL